MCTVPPSNPLQKVNATWNGFYLPGTRFFAREASGLSSMGGGSFLEAARNATGAVMLA
jgi:hypothetical protein